jgi:hypothetical protein
MPGQADLLWRMLLPLTKIKVYNVFTNRKNQYNSMSKNNILIFVVIKKCLFVSLIIYVEKSFAFIGNLLLFWTPSPGGQFVVQNQKNHSDT